MNTAFRQTGEIEAIVNPFLEYLPNLDEAQLAIIENRSILAKEQAIYDRMMTSELSKNEAALYTFTTVKTVPKSTITAVESLLGVYEANRIHNMDSAKKTKKAVPELETILADAALRPVDNPDEVLNFRIELIEKFLTGEQKAAVMFDELASYDGQFENSKLFRDDDRKIREKAACLGLERTMFDSKGIKSEEAKSICLGCRVFSSCGIIALASTNESGILMGMSARERTDFKRAVGAKALRTVLNDPTTDIFRDSVKSMLLEYQEKREPLINEVENRATTGLKIRQVQEINRKINRQLVIAMRELIRLYGV